MGTLSGLAKDMPQKKKLALLREREAKLEEKRRAQVQAWFEEFDEKVLETCHKHLSNTSTYHLPFNKWTWGRAQSQTPPQVIKRLFWPAARSVLKCE